MAGRARDRADAGHGPAAARGAADPARLAAYRLLRGVAEKQAFANLLMPSLLADAGLSGRDAALATELGYGTLRAQGTLDEILAACVDRALSSVDSAVRDLLRLGAYQALRTRVPPHAAVATTVDLARAIGQARAAGFVNAVLRRVAAADWDQWTRRLGAGGSPLRRLALATAHPEWIAAAFADALGGDLAETQAALAADDARPQTHLVALPGLCERDALVAESRGTPGPWSPYAVRLSGGEPAALASIRAGRAGVQDEGSQLCALALAAAPLSGTPLSGTPGPDDPERWLDMCAGPGGKTALLAAVAASRSAAVGRSPGTPVTASGSASGSANATPRPATVVANELREHRAELVRRATAAWDVEVHVGDARQLHGSYDRVLLDAPCTGLGALRRRPEARWRRDPANVPALAALQTELLAAALRLVRPSGVVAYVTCSPHLAETRDVINGVLTGDANPDNANPDKGDHSSGVDAVLLDARGAFPGVADLGDGPTVQLWPHRHGTDAMFFALLQRRS